MKAYALARHGHERKPVDMDHALMSSIRSEANLDGREGQLERIKAELEGLRSFTAKFMAAVIEKDVLTKDEVNHLLSMEFTTLDEDE